ncbi:MAG: bifunctional adenosylmethionine decarboxylase/class I SAM-dependent methyltransferase [Nitrososphaerales archaeon]
MDLQVEEHSRISQAYLIRAIRNCARIGGLRVIRIGKHSFSTGGFTIFALLSQSHIAIHTWPERNYVACDIFSCGGQLDSATKFLIEAISPKSVSTRIFPRGNLSGPRFNTIFVDQTGPGIRTLMDVVSLGRFISKYQEIQIFEHVEYGRVLVINEDVQFSSRDHMIYDDSLLSPLKQLGQGNKILIVGGGDGLCCTYLLKNRISNEMKVLELDPLVPQVCNKFFPKLSGGINDPAVHVIYGDASKSILEIKDAIYDGVVIDSTAPDSKWGHSTYSKRFMREVKRVLRNGGVLCMNGTSAWYKYDLTSTEIGKNIEGVFGKVRKNTSWIPSFGSPWDFYTTVKRSSMTVRSRKGQLSDP